jgi:hypothetical protein
LDVSIAFWGISRSSVSTTNCARLSVGPIFDHLSIAT